MRGCTPIHTFNLPIPTSRVASMKVTYSVNGIPVLEKRMEDFEKTEDSFAIQLTQEETLRFPNRTDYAWVEMRLVDVDGVAPKIKPFRVLVQALCTNDNEVLK